MEELPPTALMSQLLMGFQVSQAVYVVAELDIPRLALERPRTIDELAAEAGANPDALRRIIRFLETVGVFRVNEGVVEVTDLGATLSDSTPMSLRPVARFWMETHYAPFGDLLHTVRTGETAATRHLGKPFFDWIVERPHLVTLQNEAMAEGAQQLRDAALAGYQLPEGDTVADIGGADGAVLVQLLAEEPRRRGIVFDLPQVVSGAHGTLEKAGLADRIEVVGGDFFTAVPPADIYVLSTVLHDWDDDKSRQILTTVADAAQPGARLVLVEMVVPEDATPHLAKNIDLVMLAMLGGRERTATQWRDLLRSGGFRLDRIIDYPSPASVIEATLE
jgi:precorrin-6B methylase 2